MKLFTEILEELWTAVLVLCVTSFDLFHLKLWLYIKEDITLVALLRVVTAIHLIFSLARDFYSCSTSAVYSLSNEIYKPVCLFIYIYISTYLLMCLYKQFVYLYVIYVYFCSIKYIFSMMVKLIEKIPAALHQFIIHLFVFVVTHVFWCKIKPILKKSPEWMMV